MISLVLHIFLFVVIITLPVKLAASFADAENTGLVYCFLSSVLATVVAVIAFRFSSGGFPGFLLAAVAMLIAQLLILRIPAKGVISFAVVALALQGAVLFAFISFGFSLVNIVR
jgi:hypothetical protein